MGRIRTLFEHDQTREPRVRSAWGRLLSERSMETLYFQSPAYFDFLADRYGDGTLALVIVEDDRREIVGVVPLRLSKTDLHFDVGASRLGQRSLPALRILGGCPLLPESPVLFETLFVHLASEFPDAGLLEINGLSVQSPLWTFLRRWSVDSSEFLLYAPHGPRECHTTALPATFDAYLSQLKRKKRYNLKRQVRRLEEHSGGALELLRIEAPDDLPHLLHANATLSRQSNGRRDSAMNHEEVRGLAERGLLLCYVLRARGEACGLAFGTRYMRTLLMHRFAHDHKIDHLSPGIVLQTMMMQDLIEQRLVHRIDYGFGSPRLRLTNTTDDRVVALLMRRSLGNRATVLAHATFDRAIGVAKRLIRGVVVIVASYADLADQIAPIIG